MNGYYFHIGDYARRTIGLSIQQHGVYMLLLHDYYGREQPLPGDLAGVCERIGAISQTEQQDVALVLRRFFDNAGGVHRHKRADKTLELYHDRTPAREQAKMNARMRRERYNKERSILFGALHAAGARPPFNAGVASLRDIALRMGLTDVLAACDALRGVGDASGTPSADRPGRVGDGQEQEKRPGRVGDASAEASGTASGTSGTAGSMNPKPYIQGRVHTRVPDVGDGIGQGVRDASPTGVCVVAPAALEKAQAETAEAVAKAAKRAGLSYANPRDEALLALIAAGAGLADFEVAATEADAAGKSWGYMLGIVRNRLADARRTAEQAQEAAKSGDPQGFDEWARALLQPGPQTQPREPNDD